MFVRAVRSYHYVSIKTLDQIHFRHFLRAGWDQNYLLRIISPLFA